MSPKLQCSAIYFSAVLYVLTDSSGKCCRERKWHYCTISEGVSWRCFVILSTMDLCCEVQDVFDPSISGITTGTKKNSALFVAHDVVSCEILFHSFNITFPISSTEVKFSKKPMSSHHPYCQYVDCVVIMQYSKVPYSGKLSREKTFADR